MDAFNAVSIPSHFGDVGLARMGPRDHRTGNSPIEYKLSYINNLPVDVVVGWRSGLKFTLRSTPSMEKSALICRAEIFIDASVKVDVQRLLSALDQNASPELLAMREAFSLEVQENTYGGARLILDYGLTLEKLHSYGGTIYYHELDTVISVLPFDEVPPHPYSEEGRQKQVIAGSHLNHGIGFGYSVEIVDNSAKYGERYLNIGGKVYKVNPIKDPLRRSGIYILSNHPADGALGAGGLKAQRYPFEGAEQALGLYRTYEEALYSGDLASARKQEIASLEHEITRHRTELVRTKQEHDRVMFEKDVELKEVQAERDKRAQELQELRELRNHTRELELQSTKDHYERRSYQRKDQSEGIKFLPSIIVGLGAIFVAFKSFLPS